VLGDAHRQLMEIRQKHPDAGGLVIAIDQDHAQGIARLIERRFGVSATVAVSDDPMASSRIARFAASSDPWIVAVRMVSEGVDIPRLRLGVYATTTTTELFFRQAVGRLVRWTPGLRSQKAYLFIPDDPRLRRWASGIAEQRRHSRAKRDENERAEDPTALDEQRHPDDEPEQLSLFAVISAVAEQAEPPPPVHDDAEEDWSAAPSADDQGYELTLVVPPPPGAVGDGAAAGGPTRREQKSRLRELNAEAARELVRHTGMDHRAVNAELNRLAGIRRVSEATVAELERRLAAANRWLRRR
jgi:superfamily II DNA or RNA helicase